MEATRSPETFVSIEQYTHIRIPEAAKLLIKFSLTASRGIKVERLIDCNKARFN
jgi:hypothetical protein